MSTTTQLKPRPVRKRTKKMTEPLKVVIPTEPTPITITKVQSHLPDVQLIDRNALWEDFKNRVKINNYECKEVMKDLKSVVEFTKKTYNRLSK
jgi:chromatin segregation and condensation protein Rec8/ScpA/Scc1 (kleisin family)